jgi:putative membrane protein
MEAHMVRSAARLGISTLALLALAACAAAPTAQPPTPPPIATPAVPISPDQDFLNRAATGTGNEIALGRLAQARGSTASVRALGAHIAAEHSRVHAGLMALARQLNQVPNAAHADLSQLTALSGPDFDRQFLADQVRNQQEALVLFENEAQAGQDPRLRRFARDRVPMLRRDLQRAESVAARFGA